MSSVEHDLGKLGHAYVGANLKVETSGSIKISSPLATIFPFSSIFRHIENIIFSGTWVARGSGLRIFIQLLIDEVVASNFDRPTFLEGLGILLCNAELWPQLSLQASLVHSRENSSESGLPFGELVLALSYSQSCSNSRVDIESPNVPIAPYASPPVSVPYAYVDEIKLVFLFELSATAPASKRRRLGSNTEYEPDSDMLFGFRNPINSRESIDQPQSISSNRLQPHLWLYNFPVKKPDRGHDSREGPLPPESSKIDSAVKAGFVATPRSKIPPPKNSTRPADIAFTDLALLIDVGLRSMICGNIVHKHSNINLLSSSGGPKLAEIAPGLFSPGYMQALSERNSLLPTIARAMPLIHRRARSPRLKDSIKRLIDVSPEEYVSEDLSEPANYQNTTSALTAIVKARLWKLSHRKLLDGITARRLKPLACADRAFEQSLGSQVILDEGYASIHGREDVDESLQAREMLDEGYCSQRTVIEVVGEDEDDLLFEGEDLMLEDGLSESDLLFSEVEAELGNAFLDDDLFWAEDCPMQELPFDENLFYIEGAP